MFRSQAFDTSLIGSSDVKFFAKDVLVEQPLNKIVVVLVRQLVDVGPGPEVVSRVF